MIPTSIPEPLLLSGHARGPAADGATYPVLDPAAADRIALAPDAGPADLDAAVAAARLAFDRTLWSQDLDLRRHCLRQLHAALVEHGPALRGLLTAEGGVPARLTAGAQYDDPVAGLGRLADLEAAALPRPTGVVAAIVPFTAPLELALAGIGPALLAGDTVVLKPAADTPWAAAELGRLALEHTDLPPGILNVLTTRDVDVAIALTTDPRVDGVSFTGSAVVADRVRHQAAGKRHDLDEGGVGEVVVADDAGLPEAVRAAAYEVATHAGQRCRVPARVVVPPGRYDEAVAVAVEAMRALAPGDPADPATVCGPVISAVHRDRVRRYVALAEREGGTVACGGGVPAGRDTGFWVEPTVVTGLTRGARVAREEILGPVLLLIADEGSAS